MPNQSTLRHVVLFSFRADAPAEAVDKVVSDFGKLKDAIPGVVAHEWGTNVSPENLNDGFTHCFTLTFASAPARDAYLDHEAHQAFVQTLGTWLAKAMVVDYWAQ